MKSPDRQSTPLALLREAVDLALGGDWQAAHEIAQRHEENEIANWLHAVVHRMEGDLGNARYWYRRCARDLREETTTAEELLAIRAALEDTRRLASREEN